MSYCRFRNTAGDLRDCLEGLRDLFGGESLSRDELHAAKRLVGFCLEVVTKVAEQGGVDFVESFDNGSLEQRLEDAIEEMQAEAKDDEAMKSVQLHGYLQFGCGDWPR